MTERGPEELQTNPIPPPSERGSERFLSRNLLNTAIQAATVVALIITGAHIGDQYDYHTGRFSPLGLYGGIFTALAAKSFILDRFFPINQSKSPAS